MSLWQASTNDTSQWLEIDLNSDRYVRGVVIQSGSNGGAATKIRIATGLEGETSRIDVETYDVSVYSEKKQFVRFENDVTARYVCGVLYVRARSASIDITRNSNAHLNITKTDYNYLILSSYHEVSSVSLVSFMSLLYITRNTLKYRENFTRR